MTGAISAVRSAAQTVQTHPADKKHAVRDGAGGVYLERLPSGGMVYLFGGGHVAREVSPLLARVGFRHVEYVFARLREAGFTDDDLGRVSTPIGLPLGGETPAEIALSIVAQLVQLRAARER